MKRNTIRLLTVSIAASTLTSCTMNHTRFFEDNEAENLSVFTDKGFNVMSCYIDGIPYKTNDRKTYTGWGGGRSYEIYLRKMVSDTADALHFSWGNIKLVLVKEKFVIADFNQLEGQRIVVNGANGYFQVGPEQGTGTIYFHKATLAEVATGGFGGHIAGLFEITTPSTVVTNGRFDHSLETENTWFSY